jgi:hypothetical protein
VTPPAARGPGGITLQAMPDPGDVRVSDDERERVAREIREHYAAGRLDDNELNERVEAAYAARTLVRNGWRLYGPAPELDRVEEELTRRSRGGDRHRHRRHRSPR